MRPLRCLLPALAAPAAATARSAACAHADGATTLQSTAQVAVYRSAGSDFGARFYACWQPTGRELLLHTNTTGADVTDAIFGQAAIAGRVVAFHVAATGDRNYDFVRSFDVRSGRRLRRSGIVGRGSRNLPQPAPPSAIATNSHGAIAWLASGILRVTDVRNTRAVATIAPGPITGVRATERAAHWRQLGRPFHTRFVLGRRD
ncbi:MAG TPA: hypothetical protein VMY78_08130 [Solirubrobacteraceae bacterium]|nr:hypothetical protein [Solirubrobacteraceae bacterium]